MTGLAVLLAVLGGLCGSVQVAVMGRFGGRVGVLEALAFSTAIQLVLSVAVMLAARGGIGGLRHVSSTPSWMWIGGLMGFDAPTCLALAGARRIRDLLFYVPGLIAWQFAEAGPGGMKTNARATAGIGGARREG